MFSNTQFFVRVVLEIKCKQGKEFIIDAFKAFQKTLNDVCRLDANSVPAWLTAADNTQT